MRLHTFFVTTIAALAAIGQSRAQDRAVFAQLDTNHDGYVSLDEVPAEHRAKFERLLKLAGKEQDKKLNRALFEGAAKADKPPGESPRPTSEPAGAIAQAADLFGRLDANRDGVVTADEAGETQRAVFERLLKNGDIDSDGKLSREEYSASTKETAAQRQPGRSGGPPGPARPGGLMIDSRELFARMDRNQDGKLSKDEAPPRMQENFDRLDANGDGSLNPEEFARVAGPLGQRPPFGAGGAPPPGSLPVVFALLDTDRDGEISTSEIVAAGTVLLKLDRNGDGKLSPEEVFSAGPGRLQRPPQP